MYMFGVVGDAHNYFEVHDYFEHTHMITSK